MPALGPLLHKLEAHYGPQKPAWPTEPYRFLIWWYCGYPASDGACAKGWASLNRSFGLKPNQLLAANPAKLAMALRPGGMFPEQRALRLKETADKVLEEFGGDLDASLRRLPLTKARAALKTFHSIANPGADRILLFAGISAVAAVPSNCAHVTTRVFHGNQTSNYSREYADAQRRIEAETPPDFEPRTRAYLLLKAHGQQLCKRSNPLCNACPIAASCAFVKARK